MDSFRFTLRGSSHLSTQHRNRNQVSAGRGAPATDSTATTERPSRWPAVIFDLWDTLVEFPLDVIAARDAAIAHELAVDTDELRSTWLRLEAEWETTPLMPSLELLCRELGAHDFDLKKLCRLRLEYMRQALQPRAEVIEMLQELRRRGLRLGLITACSGDVPMVWSETPLDGLFDATIFSCEVGLCKPDVRIYRRAAAALRLPPARCLYVGDGGHDELAGAAQAGMTPVLLRSQRTSTRPDLLGWTHEIDTILATPSLL
jgi:putative hydrolase of the HAD superfamily